MRELIRNFDDLPTEFHEDAQTLRRLSIYVKHRRTYPDRVCGVVDAVNFLYWPAIYASYRIMSFFAEKVKCPRRIDSTRTYRRFLRQHVEHLLGPLQLPAVHDNILGYANHNARLYGWVPSDFAYKPFIDTDNYTCFRHLMPQEGAGVRIRIVPPPRGLIARWMDELPPELCALHYAWTYVRRRSADNLFWGTDVGVDYSATGRIVIAWPTLLAQMPPGHQGKELLPDKLYEWFSVKNRYPYSLKNGVITHKHKQYVSEVQSAGFNINDSEQYFTVIDPILLFRKPKLFEGQYYFNRKQKQKENQKIAARRRETGQPLANPTKLHSFTFHPKDYLPKSDKITEKLPEFQWFSNDHKEEVYAIRWRGELLFARPSHLTTKDPRCIFDVNTWQRALASLKMVQGLTDDGDLGSAFALSKSKYFKMLTEELRQKAMASFLTNYAQKARGKNPDGSPTLSVRQWRKAMQLYAAEQQESDPAILDSMVRAGHWHNKLIAKAAREFTKASPVLRQAYVQLPGKTICGTIQFYFPIAVETFREFAEGSFGIIAAKHCDTPMESLLRGGGENHVQPAPYILAWARFCETMQHESRTGIIGAKTSRWSPLDDFTLLQGYSTRPKMKPKDWSNLLAQIPHRTREMCKVHASQCNRTIKKCLTPKRFAQQRFGFQKCTEVDAKRSVLILGCIHTLRRRGRIVDRKSLFLKQIYEMTDKELLDFSLPARYDKHGFATLLDDC